MRMNIFGEIIFFMTRDPRPEKVNQRNYIYIHTYQIYMTIKNVKNLGF